MLFVNQGIQVKTTTQHHTITVVNSEKQVVWLDYFYATEEDTEQGQQIAARELFRPGALIQSLH